MQPEKVHLTGAKQTLLITLHAKAMESRSPNSLLKDRFADQALPRIDYDFKRLDLGPDGAISLAMRAKTFDDWTRAFIEEASERDRPPPRLRPGQPRVQGRPAARNRLVRCRFP